MQITFKRSYNLNYFLSLLLASMSVMVLTSQNAQATPSFSRQTGQSCSVCHTQSFGPNLTPFGRDFKLGGYTMGGGTGTAAKMPALSGMITGSFTNTQKDQPDGTLLPGYNKNNNFSFDEASLFYAGRVYEKVGAFSQLTYNGYDDKLEMDKTDIRFADQLELFDAPITYGISLNNAPTVQDLWNTSSWGFPYTESAVKPGVGSSALVDGGLDSQVGGATAYTMINNLVYLEAGAYDSFSNNAQRAFGTAQPDRYRLAGPAPYWRAALQQDWKGHFFSVGHYGLSADVSLPGRDSSFGYDHFTDVAFDATYQYMANPKHIFEVKTAYIYEDQKLSATRMSLGDPSTGRSYLNTYKLNLAYTFDQTYGITFAYNKISGSNTAQIASPGVISGLSKPNSDFYTAELVYVPFGKSNAYSYLMNLRTSLQYIGYSQANGTQANAQDNNTFMVNGWLAF
jgi:hypothetical protein